MANTSDIRTTRHCVTDLHVHLVFLTKDRDNIFTPSVLDTLDKVFTRICTDFESTLIKIEGERNYVHLLIRYPPKVAIAKLVNSLKGVSSRMLKKEHPDIEKFYINNSLWSPSYLASSCAGSPITILKEYINKVKQL